MTGTFPLRMYYIIERGKRQMLLLATFDGLSLALSAVVSLKTIVPLTTSDLEDWTPANYIVHP